MPSPQPVSHQAVSAQPSANPVPTIAPLVSVGAPDPAEVKAQAAARELAAYKTAEPVFTRYCASCHQKGGKHATAKTLAHLDISTYPFKGHHAAEIGPKLRQVLGIGGGKATLPKGRPGIVGNGELDEIAAFCAAWDEAHPGVVVAPDND